MPTSAAEVTSSPAPAPAPAPSRPAPPASPPPAPASPAVPPPPYDAVLVPHLYPEGKKDIDLLKARKDEFLPLLKPGPRTTLVFSHSVFGTTPPMDIVRLGTREGLIWNPGYNFPIGHPLHGEPRYTWTDRGDGVLYGTLVADPHAEQTGA